MLDKEIAALNQGLQTLAKIVGDMQKISLQSSGRSFSGHKFLTAPNPLIANTNEYTLPRPVDYVFVASGQYDYQVEFDQDVTDQTPVIPALLYLENELTVKDRITYKLSPAVVQSAPTAKDVLYIFMYWY